MSMTTSEILILPDGTVLAHNITPEMAAALHELNPQDETIGRRVCPSGAGRETHNGELVSRFRAHKSRDQDYDSE